MLQDQLKIMRIQMGLTQVEMSKRTGLSQQYISRIEAGKPVTLETIEKYAGALDRHITTEQNRFYNAMPGTVENAPTSVRKKTYLFRKYSELSERQFVILSHVAALEALGLFPGYGVGYPVDYYAKEESEIADTVFHKVTDFRDVGVVRFDGMCCTDTNRTFNDVLAEYDSIDDGVILDSLQTYYLKHGSSFDTLRIEPQNMELFESMKEDAIHY